MKRLYVLFDQDCRLCEAVVRRLREQPTFVELEFVSSGAPLAARKFPGIVSSVPLSEVVAIADSGEVYRGESAWLMVLWAMKRYRHWSIALAQPAYRGLVRRAVASIGRYRMTLSGLIREQAGSKRGTAVDACASNACTATWQGVKRGVGEGEHAGQRPDQSPLNQ